MSDFPFSEGELVTVTAREDGEAVARFTAECEEISGGSTPIESAKARFPLPFGTMNTVTVRPYEAEFEVHDGESWTDFDGVGPVRAQKIRAEFGAPSQFVQLCKDDNPDVPTHVALNPQRLMEARGVGYEVASHIVDQILEGLADE